MLLMIFSIVLFCLSVFTLIFIHRRQVHEDTERMRQAMLALGTASVPANTMKPQLPDASPHTAIKGLQLTQEQKALFSILEYTNEHVFVTGKAGTGKSVLLQYFQAQTHKRVAVVAPTGAAALQVNGQTIHSLFHFPLGFIQEKDVTIDTRTTDILRHIDVLVVDEASMVRVDVMEAIHRKLQRARKSDMPFGGVQVVLFGDLYQLPPVCEDDLEQYVTSKFGGPYFFNAPIWKEAILRIYELHVVHRQRDGQFRQLLNAIRQGEVSEEVLAAINTRADLPLPQNGLVTLTGHTAVVTNLNKKRLAALHGREYVYVAEASGKFTQSVFPADEVLRLKVGAQVILLKNDKQRRWANGTVGVIRLLDKDSVRVTIGEHTYAVPREAWNKIRYVYDREKNMVTQEVVSSFTQFPLRLAWAMTIHKAQGQTYESIIVDLTYGVFAHGQIYVALSRCRSLNGIYLTRPITKEDIIVDPRIVAFMNDTLSA